MFTDHELKYLADREFLLTKKSIQTKVYQLFNSVVDNIKENPRVIPQHLLRNPNFSRGENYRDLPYFVLDYPNHFSRSDIFTIRSIVRWGHEFSFHLLVSGNFKDTLVLEDIINEQLNSPIWICVNDSPWEHYFEASNYKLINKITDTEIEGILRKDFRKIAFSFDLEKLNLFTQLGIQSIDTFLKFLDFKKTF